MLKMSLFNLANAMNNTVYSKYNTIQIQKYGTYKNVKKCCVSVGYFVFKGHLFPKVNSFCSKASFA